MRIGQQFEGDIFVFQIEFSSVRWAFGKDDRIARIGAESVRTGLEPEQAGQRQPVRRFASTGRRPHKYRVRADDE